MMKCILCDKGFNSFKWYEFDANRETGTELVMCDYCLLSLYKAKKATLESNIAELNNKIKEIEDSLI